MATARKTRPFNSLLDTRMSAEDLGKSKLANMLLKPAGSAMESRLRHLLQDPERILRGADLQPGQTVLEVGSGTGFFTIPTARMIGDNGRLIAMEPLAAYVERLNEKVDAAGLRNVCVVRRDALHTRLDAACIDMVLLFGVLPFVPLRHPFTTLPLNRLLTEMHRVLKPGGKLAVWMFPIAGLVPLSIRRSGLFDYLHKRNGVHNYRRCPAESEDFRTRPENGWLLGWHFEHRQPFERRAARETKPPFSRARARSVSLAEQA